MSGYNATQTDGSPTPIPMSSAISPGDATPYAIKGGPKVVDGQGNTLVGVAVYVYDGDQETIGAKANAAQTDATQTASLMAFSKGFVKILADVWSSTLHILQVGRACTAVYTQASVTTSGSTQNSGDLTVGPFTELSIDITTTDQAGTSPTIQYFWERKGADGLYYVLWSSAVCTAAANTISTSIGPGLIYYQSLGLIGRLRWVVGGTSTPTYTHSLNVFAK